MVDYRGHLVVTLSTDPHSPDMTVSSIFSASYMVFDITDNNNFAAVLDQHVMVDVTTAIQTAWLSTLQQKLAVDSNMLIQRWGIPLHKAKQTVQCTTQHCMRNIANLTLVHRFCTNDCMLQYCCLHHTIFTDTMFASTLSRRSNKCAQIFSSNFGWSCAYPMRTKGQAHDTLPLMFQCEGVLPHMVMNGSKEQTLGKFHQKLCDAGCKKKATEPCSPWKNAAEQEAGDQGT